MAAAASSSGLVKALRGMQLRAVRAEVRMETAHVSMRVTGRRSSGLLAQCVIQRRGRCAARRARSGECWAGMPLCSGMQPGAS
eukprot:4167068-Prymnesium_polylepis.1